MLEILISSSVLIGVLALLRRLLRGRISARLQYALWALVLLRLLVPVTTFESKVSVAAVAEPIAAQVQEYSAQRVQTVYIPVDMGENPQTGEPMEAVGRTFVEPLDVARWLWYAGMGVTALFFAGVNLRMARRLKKDRVYYGSHRSVPVYIAQKIPSPCLFGLFRPAIYLTEPAAADETQAGQILAHEYSHLCHGDLFWALMRSLCLVIYWFDPFVWWAAVLSRRDGELACDESAIRRLGEEQRFDYGRTLLALATVKLRPGDLLCGATTMTGGKNSLRERIEGIARTKKLSLSLAAVALVIVALAVGCTFSGADSGEAVSSPAPTITPAPIPVPTDGTVLNADPAEDVLGTEMQTATESRELTRITIPAGCSMGQIFQLLEDNGICDKEALYEAAANYDFSYDWLEELPLGDATRLEGYLFPDTYDFYPGEPAVNVIDRFLNRFLNILTPDMQKQADKLNISLHEAVIIASLIEKEAGAGDDRSLFSSVIHNRLYDGWKLQLDSTLNYIKGTSTFDLTYEDMEIDSPYNTYLYEGLPAGPICSPGKASLEAALNPSSTNYWYWYTFEGATHFFSSDSEFSEFAAAHPHG